VSANAIRNLADPVVLTTLVRLANQPVTAATESGQVVTASICTLLLKVEVQKVQSR
jgi:hypothetical protein